MNLRDDRLSLWVRVDSHLSLVLRDPLLVDRDLQRIPIAKDERSSRRTFSKELEK